MRIPLNLGHGCSLVSERKWAEKRSQRATLFSEVEHSKPTQPSFMLGPDPGHRRPGTNGLQRLRCACLGGRCCPRRSSLFPITYNNTISHWPIALKLPLRDLHRASMHPRLLHTKVSALLWLVLWCRTLLLWFAHRFPGAHPSRSWRALAPVPALVNFRDGPGRGRAGPAEEAMALGA